jgi:hypothetical protein
MNMDIDRAEINERVTLRRRGGSMAQLDVTVKNRALILGFSRIDPYETSVNTGRDHFCSVFEIPRTNTGSRTGRQIEGSNGMPEAPSMVYPKSSSSSRQLETLTVAALSANRSITAGFVGVSGRQLAAGPSRCIEPTKELRIQFVGEGHPSILGIFAKPKRRDAAVSTDKDLQNFLRIPYSVEIKIAQQASLSRVAFLSLALRLDTKAKIHDNLSQMDFTHISKEGIVLQPLLLDLTGTEKPAVPITEAARTELIDLMARILVAVFQAEGGRVNDRTFVQSKNQAGAPCAQGHCLPAAIQRETGAAE